MEIVIKVERGKMFLSRGGLGILSIEWTLLITLIELRGQRIIRSSEYPFQCTTKMKAMIDSLKDSIRFASFP